MSNPNISSFKTLTLADIKKNRKTASQRLKAEEATIQSAAGSGQRKTKDTPTVAALIQATDHLKSGDRGAAQAWSTIQGMHFNPENVSETLNPRDAYKWSQRMAVMWRKPSMAAGSVDKTEIMAVLSKLNPVAVKMLELGYSQDYSYNPTFTTPAVRTYLTFYRRLAEGPYGNAMMKASKKVFFTPLLGNMLAKTAKYLAPEMPDESVELAALIHSRFKCTPTHDWFRFKVATAKAALDGKLNPEYVAQVANSLKDWFLSAVRPASDGTYLPDAPIVFKNTSPGMPYQIMKTPQGGSYGSCQSPHFLEHFVLGKGSVAERFLSVVVKDVLAHRKKWFTPAPKADPKHLRQVAAYAAYEYGCRLYLKLASQSYGTPDKGGRDLSDFWGHILSSVAAGNTKPVEFDEIKDGKPDRSIYSDPALLRFLGAKINLAGYEATQTQTPYYVKPGFMKGAADAYVTRVLEALGRGEAPLQEISTQYDNLKEFGLEDVVSVKPDVRAMDMHTPNNAIHHLYKPNYVLPISELPDFDEKNIAALGLLVVLGFYAQSSANPLCLTNAGVIYHPTHLNMSGKAHTYLCNQRRSAIVTLGLEGRLPGQKHLLSDLGMGFKFTHAAVGDDQDINILVPPRATAVGVNVNVNQRDKDGRLDPDAQYNYDHVQTTLFGRFRYDPTNTKPAKVGGVFGEIEKAGNFKFKPDTLVVDRTLSASPFLGHHLYLSREFAGDDTAPVFLAARPLEDILFSTVWPRHVLTKNQTSRGITPMIYDAIRAYAGFLEAAPAYPGARVALELVFEEARKAAGSVAWDNPAIVSLFDETASNPHTFGYDAPSDILAEQMGSFVPSKLPTLSDVWFIHTALDMPLKAGVPEFDSSDETGDLDLDDLDENVPSQPRAATSAKEQAEQEPEVLEDDLDDL